MGSEWALMELRTIRSNGTVQFPEEAAEHTTFDHDIPAYGKCVWWSYEKHGKYPVISNTQLEKPNYITVDFHEYNGDDTLTIPRDVISETDNEHVLKPGEDVVFLSYEEMLENGTRSVFVLPKNDVLKLLPDAGDDDDRDLKTKILDTPGFISSI